MDIRGENSSSHQGYPVEVSWAPETPANPGLSDPKMNCENGSKNQLNKTSFEETVMKGSFGCWEDDLGLKGQLCDMNVGMYDSFLMDNVEMWNSIPCRDLLALANAATTTKDSSSGGGSGGASGGGDSYTNMQFENQNRSFGSNFHSECGSTPDPRQYGRPNPSAYLFDLNSPPTNITEPPVTAEQARRAEDRQAVSDVVNTNKDGRTNQVAEKHEERFYLEEQPQLIIEQSQGAISTQVETDQDFEKGSSDETNLIRTPQPKQRRRKHRPKVVIEGQPKSARKLTTPKPEGSSTGKRKYVRKIGVDKSTATPTTDETSGTTYPSAVRQTRNSCRRKINFDEEQNLHTGVQSTVQPGQGTGVMVEKTRVDLTFDKAFSRNHVEKHSKMLESQALSPVTPNKTELTRETPTREAKHTSSRAKCHINFSEETRDKEQRKEPSPNENSQSSACFNKREEARRPKRDRSSKIDGIELGNENAMGVRFESLEAYLSMYNNYNNGSMPGLHFPAIYKKKRTEKCQGSVTSSTVSSVWSAQAPFAIKAPETSIVYGVKDYKQSYKNMLAFVQVEGFRKKRTKGLTRVRDLASFAGMMQGRQWPTPNGAYKASHQRHTCLEALVADFGVRIATKKRTKRNSIVPSSLYHNHQFLTNHIGLHPGLRWKSTYDIDALINQFEHLDINSRMVEVEQDRHALIPYLTRYQEKNALVLYRRDRSLVPFEDFYSPVRRRKPRPQVDLDDETTRVWRLLLEDINSQGIDGTDKEKAKWWEEERSVFHGRAASFIARMHLVQGDRRFSQWKGSVVDSVIGVFLTQNVSDHLSSSAFMSLAARYPLKSKSSKKPLQEDISSISVREPCQVDLDETIKWREKSNQQLTQDHGSMTLQDAECYEEKEVVNSNEFCKISPASVGMKEKSAYEVLEVSGNELAMYKESAGDTSATHTTGMIASFTGNQREVDNLVSSQNSVYTYPNSVQSTIAHTAERLGSCSMSNSGAELTDGSKATIIGESTSFVELSHMQGSTMSHEVNSQKQANELSNKIGQDKLESMSNSQEQNEGISHDCTASGLMIPPKDSELQSAHSSGALEVEYFELREERKVMHKKCEEKCASEQSELSAESASQATVQIFRSTGSKEASKSCNTLQAEVEKIFRCEMTSENPKISSERHTHENNSEGQEVVDLENFSAGISEVTESNSIIETSRETAHKVVESNSNDHDNLQTTVRGMDEGSSKAKRGKNGKAKQIKADWDSLRIQAQVKCKRERTPNTMDSLDYEAVRCADVDEIADIIKERGMNNMLAERIKDFLNRLVSDHGSIDLEWLRDVPPDKAKEYLLSFRGLGLKSVECVRLLTLHHLAFPVDTNVGRIAVRLGWVPLQPLPESLQLHLLELYPVLESIQKYLWPRLCKLDQRTLYELHYQMITFGKVFCTKNKPNCNACPMRGECRHFASAFASARLALPAPQEKSIVSATENKTPGQNPTVTLNQQRLTLPPANQQLQQQSEAQNCAPVIEEPATPEPMVEVPATPEPEQIQQQYDMEDFCEDPEEIPMINLNIEEFTRNLQTYMKNDMELGQGDMSRALVALTSEAASIPTPKLKNVSQLRTEHQVYELPDSHPLLEGLDKREPDDPCSYLLAIWTPGETADSIQPPGGQCSCQESGTSCNVETCFLCNSIREANSQTVRGTLLIPCRTAMRGSFPLNGTYFQVNEVFADHDSSLNPIDVPRSWLWNLPRRIVYFGTSIPTIFKGLTTEGIQYCFWRGFVCVRGFDQKTRAPRPLMARLHFPASKLKRSRGKTDEN